MDLTFTKPQASDWDKVSPFFTLRPNKTCDSGALDTFLWADYYKIRYCLKDDKALLFLMQDGEELFTCMPYCREEELEHYFIFMKEYFNTVLKKPFKIYLADDEAVSYLSLMENPNYLVEEETDFRDYLYDAEELKTLPGKKFHKKKNLINKFIRDYEGRWEYRSLNCCDKPTIWEFLDRWYAVRSEEESDGEESLEYEVKGIHDVLSNCSIFDFHIGGIFVDGKLEAFSMGAYNKREQMAVIDIEKGNQEISGIYQIMNQQFLIHEFPDAVIVNREDDVGLPGLRRSKESYNPIGYEKKYMVLQKDFEGYEKELTDHYEAEIENYETDADKGQ